VERLPAIMERLSGRFPAERRSDKRRLGYAYQLR